MMQTRMRGSGLTSAMAVVAAMLAVAGVVAVCLSSGRSSWAAGQLGTEQLAVGDSRAELLGLEPGLSRRVRGEQKALAHQIGKLNSLKEQMFSQLSKAGVAGPKGTAGLKAKAEINSLNPTAFGPQLLGELKGMARSAAELRQKLREAAGAEQNILVQSEEVEDGGCKDHHQEQCGGESCCTFWAKKGQCSADRKEWMAVMCSLSCGACSAKKPIVPAQELVVGDSHSHDDVPVRKGLKEPTQAQNSNSISALAGHKQLVDKDGSAKHKVDISVLLHGENAVASKAEIVAALHRAIALVEPRIAASDVVLDRISAVGPREPVRRLPKRTRATAFLHASRPADYGSTTGFREEVRLRPQNSFGPKRRLLELEELAGPVRVQFHVNVPTHVNGNKLAAALKSQLREILQREVHHRSVEVESARHVYGLSRRQSRHFGDLLSGGKVSARYADADISATQIGLHGPSEDRQFDDSVAAFDKVLGAAPGTNPAMKLTPAQKAAQEAAVAAEKAEKLDALKTKKKLELAAEEEGEAGEGAHLLQPGVGLGVNDVARKQHQDEEEEARQKKKLTWSFQQPLTSSSESPERGVEKEKEKEFEWHYKRPYPDEPKPVDDSCDTECLKKRFEIAEEKHEQEEAKADAQDLVSVKKEHVIEDVRHLKQLMKAMKEEDQLLESQEKRPESHEHSVDHILGHHSDDEDEDEDEDEGSEEGKVAADEYIAAEKQRQYYKEKIEEVKADAAKERAKEKILAGELEKKHDAAAISRSAQDMRTQIAVDNATIAEGRLHRIENRIQRAKDLIKKHIEEQKEIEKYNLEHDGKVNVHAHFNIDSPKGKNIPQWYVRQLHRLKGTGADKGVVHLNLGINVDKKPLGATEQQSAGGAGEDDQDDYDDDEPDDDFDMDEPGMMKDIDKQGAKLHAVPSDPSGVNHYKLGRDKLRAEADKDRFSSTLRQYSDEWRDLKQSLGV